MLNQPHTLCAEQFSAHLNVTLRDAQHVAQEQQSGFGFPWKPPDQGCLCPVVVPPMPTDLEHKLRCTRCGNRELNNWKTQRIPRNV